MIEQTRVIPAGSLGVVPPQRRRRARARRWRGVVSPPTLGLTVLAVLACAGWSCPLRAQAPAATPDAARGVPPAVLTADFTGPADGGGLQLTNCESCGTYGGPCCGPRVPHLGGAAACCYPGRYPCDCCDCPQSCLGAFCHGIYHCICCPDPCYEPVWKAIGNAAFFVDQVRPITQLKIGTDLGWDVRLPDKAELFWARQGGRGPKIPGGGPAVRSLDYQDFYVYTEAAVDRFGLFVYTPYRHVSPNDFDALFRDGSGFGDMAVGTKSLLLDCELIQVTFQFRTWLPTGDAGKGVGTGHTSLEPSVISAIKITNDDYLQCQLAYLFPLGGTAGFQGSLVSWGLSYNRLLWQCGKDLQLIGTAESNLWWITDGRYTDPVTAQLVRASELSPMWNLGGGVRAVWCSKIDIGVGYSGAVTDDRMVGHLLRAEFRWRF